MLNPDLIHDTALLTVSAPTRDEAMLMLWRDQAARWEQLETAGRLFTEIRGDFLDPREVCDEGRETINIALSTYAAAVGSKEARG